MIPNPCIEVQTSPATRPSVPEWFAEVTIIVHHLTGEGVLNAFAHQIRLVRGRFGTYEPIDFLALLLGYAMSGERTLADFFERVAPFESAFMALFGRRCLPHRSSLSRFLADVDRPCLEAFRTLFQHHAFTDGWSLVASLTARVAAVLSSMWMLHARPHGNERCRVVLNFLRHNAASMRSVRLGTKGASEVK